MPGGGTGGGRCCLPWFRVRGNLAVNLEDIFADVTGILSTDIDIYGTPINNLFSRVPLTFHYSFWRSARIEA